MKKSLLVNVYGAPGSGKSTLALGLAYYLKRDRLDVDLASEYAKELTYDERWNTLKDQIHIFAEQRARIERLLPHCDVVVTDCPVLLGALYYPELFPDSFRDLMRWSVEEHDTLNLFLERAHPYSTHGRRQSEGESDVISQEMKSFLDKSGVKYHVLKGDDAGLEQARGLVRARLDATAQRDFFSEWDCAACEPDPCHCANIGC